MASSSPVALARKSLANVVHDRRRNGRKREVRKVTLGFRRAADVRFANLVLGLDGTERPQPRRLPVLRLECEEATRPCPHVTCKHHLFLDVSELGTVTLNFPDVDTIDLKHSCCLDVAADGGRTLEQVGEIMNLTRERVRQIEASALRKLRDLKRLPR